MQNTVFPSVKFYRCWTCSRGSSDNQSSICFRQVQSDARTAVCDAREECRITRAFVTAGIVQSMLLLQCIPPLLFLPFFTLFIFSLFILFFNYKIVHW